MTINIKTKMMSLQNKLPRQQKNICKFIINNMDEVSTMTINELSDESGVGTTTILRFLDKLGYKGYLEFKNSVIKYTLNNKKNTWWHLKKSIEERDKDNNSLTKVGKDSILDIESMLENLNVEEYNKFIKLLTNSEKVYFLGMRTSKSLALYFEMMLREILDNLNQLSFDTDFLYDNSLKFTNNSTLVVIAISPYTTDCINFVNFCRKNSNVSIALITDMETCPMIEDSDAYLVVGRSKNRYSVIPAITLMESFIIDLGKRNSQALNRINKLNKVHQDRNITTN